MGSRLFSEVEPGVEDAQDRSYDGWTQELLPEFFPFHVNILTSPESIHGPVGKEIGKWPHWIGDLVGEQVPQEGEADAQDYGVPSGEIPRQEGGNYQFIAVEKEPCLGLVFLYKPPVILYQVVYVYHYPGDESGDQGVG